MQKLGWVILIVGVIVAIMLAGVFGYNLRAQAPGVSEEAQENTSRTASPVVQPVIYVYVTPTPEPTRTPVPTKAPTPIPRIPLSGSQVRSIFEIDFDRALSGISAEERGMILGRENQDWKSFGQKEIVYNAISNYRREKRNEVSSVDGMFAKFLYTQDGTAYLANNVSVPSGTASALRAKKITMSVGYYINQEGHRDYFVNFYKDSGIVVATGIGGNVKITTIYLPGSDSGDGGGGSSGGSSGSSGGGGSGGDSGSGDSGGGDSGSPEGGVGS